MHPKVDTYLLEGCGRCEHYRTPDCKVLSWTKELNALRSIVLSTGLEEEFKWSQPCYTLGGKNVLIVTAFKDFACISFFKGSLLEDTHELLVKPGPNSQAGRFLSFKDVETIKAKEDVIKSYIFQAIDAEKAGLQVEFVKNPEPIPDELQNKLDEDPIFRAAFEGLTPGRQRGYILHFSQPKQSSTRIGRIEKCTAKILNGEGMHDGYRRNRE